MASSFRDFGYCRDVKCPAPLALLLVMGAVLLSWTVAETYSRLAMKLQTPIRTGESDSPRRLSLIRPVIVAIVDFTVLLIGLALLVLPGPAFIVIPLGLAILATEFVWARMLLKRARGLLARSETRKG